MEQLGHPVLASAAYNAGPSRARRWRDTRALEGAVYVESIPFAETRDYVRKVMANSVLYSCGAQPEAGAVENSTGRDPAARRRRAAHHRGRTEVSSA